MLDSIFNTGSLSIPDLFLCTFASLALGIGIAAVYMFRTVYSKNFVVTLALLPAMVQIVILMVNGNLGTGVAVLGAFSLIRFRSVPGSAREISSIFFAMAIGLAIGMGYLLYAFLFLLVIGGMTLLLTILPFGERKQAEKDLKITIPENLDYNGLLDDVFHQYTKKAELQRVRTTNMGSLYELQYQITLRDIAQEKEFLDAVRCRNGNLNITCGRVSSVREEL